MATKRCESGALDIHQPIEERAIAPQSNPQVFRGNAISALPLVCERLPFLGKAFGQLVKYGFHQAVGVFYGRSRLVDECRLDIAPARSVISDVGTCE